MAALIAHVEAFHAAAVDVGAPPIADTDAGGAGAGAGTGAERPEICPICAARFATVEELVQHSTTAHRAAGVAVTVTGGARGEAAAETRARVESETSDGGGGSCVVQ